MRRPLASLLLTLCAVPVLATAAQGQAPRLDRYGDPLPEGAVVRLGTERFQGNHSVSSVVFSPDGRLLASGNWDMAIRVWDTTTYREHHRFFVGWRPDG